MIWSNLWYGFNLFKPSISYTSIHNSNNPYIPIGRSIININSNITQCITFNSANNIMKSSVIGGDERYNKTNNHEEIWQIYSNIEKKGLLDLLQSDIYPIPDKLELLVYYNFIFNHSSRSSIFNGGLLDDYNFEDF